MRIRLKSERKFDAVLDGHRCYGSDAPPPPDYGPMAAANVESARIMKETADADRAFRVKVYEEQKPQTEALQKLLVDSTTLSNKVGADNAARAAEQWAAWEKTYKPIEETVAREAAEMGGAVDQERAAGQAVTDVNARYAAAEKEINAADPNMAASRFGRLGLALSKARDTAYAATGARETQKDKGFTARAGVANFGRGMPNTAAQSYGLTLQSGQTQAGTAGTATNMGLAAPNFVSGATGNQLTAGQSSINSNLGLAGLMSGDYRTGVQAASAESAGIGQLVGTGMTAAAIAY